MKTNVNKHWQRTTTSARIQDIVVYSKGGHNQQLLGSVWNNLSVNET